MVKVRNIGIFGRRNVGKSTLINLICGAEISIVSPVAGTTTDPVRKRFELPEVGPCNIIDTAGVDDSGELGLQRVKRSEKIMDEIDMAILLFSGNIFAKEERDLMVALKERDLPVLALHNQSDIVPLDVDLASELNSLYGVDVLEFSCAILDEKLQMEAKEQLLSFLIKGIWESARSGEERPLFDGLVSEGDKVILVCPIDSEAPHGRLILPQVMALRDLLDRRAAALVVQPSQLESLLLESFRCRSAKSGNSIVESNIKMVVTDSQAFKEVAGTIDKVMAEIAQESGEGRVADIPLTSFSILMARSKGPFEEYVKGIAHLDSLKDGDNLLVLESCTHHSSCEDIGRVKIPRGLKGYLKSKYGKEINLNFDFVSGLDEIPFEKEYALAIQCGGCMVTRRQLINRMKRVCGNSIPIVNYGMLLAHIGGISQRALEPLAR